MQKFNIRTKQIRKHKSISVVLTLIVGIVFVVGIIVIANGFVSKNKTCAEIIQESDQLIKDKKYKSSAGLLKPSESRCGKSYEDIKQQGGANSQSQIESIKFNSDLAISLYKTGEKQAAKEVAKKVLYTNEHIDVAQRSKIKDLDKRMSDILMIYYGIKAELTKVKQ